MFHFSYYSFNFFGKPLAIIVTRHFIEADSIHLLIDVKKRNQSNIIEQQGGQEHPEAGGQEAVLEVVPWG